MYIHCSLEEWLHNFGERLGTRTKIYLVLQMPCGNAYDHKFPDISVLIRIHYSAISDIQGDSLSTCRFEKTFDIFESPPLSFQIGTLSCGDLELITTTAEVFFCGG